MNVNLEVAFHNMDTSPSLESLIAERAERLKRRYDRLVGVRVVVEKQMAQHRTGNVFDVHVELMVPGTDLVVSRPAKVQKRYSNPDAATSVRDAFDAAERQLQDYKGKQRNPARAPLPHEPGMIPGASPAE